MPIFEKWYERKKPTLQIKVLRSIAFEGESSKRKLQVYLNAHYPDISDAVKSLKKGLFGTGFCSIYGILFDI